MGKGKEQVRPREAPTANAAPGHGGRAGDRQARFGNQFVQDQLAVMTAKPAAGGPAPGGDAVTDDPVAQQGNAHFDPELSDGVQVGADGKEKAGPQGKDAAEQPVSRNVLILAPPESPVRLGAGARPAESALLKDVKKGGEAVSSQRGTVEDPIVAAEAQQDALYVDGAPNVADVRQGGLGDCYFESVLLGIVQRDPATISGMVERKGRTVTVTFQHLDPVAGAWQPSAITVDASLQFAKGADGEKDGKPVGADFRVADAPKGSDWSAYAGADALFLQRRDTYEAAMWAPLMEKAYARFAQRWGKYGRGVDRDAFVSGYDTIGAGGEANEAYRIFYGGAVEASGTTEVKASEGKDPVLENLPALEKLLTHGRAGGRRDGGTRLLQARLSSDNAVARLSDAIEAARKHLADQTPGAVRRWLSSEAEATAAPLQRLTKELDYLQTAAWRWQADRTDRNRDLLLGLARNILDAEKHPQLRSDPALAGLLELSAVVANAGSDKGPGIRQIYADHSYNVQDVRIVGRDGRALDLDAESLPKRAAEIDLDRSSVVMQNPHAENEPNLDGSAASDGKNDGRFDLSLRSFLRDIDMLRSGDIQGPAG
ncbi:MAG: hypothetical protein ACOZNI_27685 [Myxococcota bacterium]